MLLAGSVLTMLLAAPLVALAHTSSELPVAPQGPPPQADLVGVGLPALKLQTVASGLAKPVFATGAGDGSGRLFIVEQRGTIQVLKGGVLSTWLDIRSKVRFDNGEQGLLGLAFAPDFRTSGVFYVSYTAQPLPGDASENTLERYVVSDPENGLPSPSSGQVLLQIHHPFENHNAGMIAFGPDGYLYYTMGDGGSGGDPFDNAQNTFAMLGKMFRLDVSGTGGYKIPPGNPFANGGGRPEVFAYGLRNPWRFSFDRQTGDLWIGDVGQNLVEEIDMVPAGQGAGWNFGWRGWEATYPYNPTEAANEIAQHASTLHFPTTWYYHPYGCAVMGGYVYRGSALPIQGVYLYGDYCSGQVWAAVGQGGVTVGMIPVLAAGAGLSAFGQDDNGELYTVNLNGSVSRIVQGP
jgi:glucose/arabinose dehydrogenase